MKHTNSQADSQGTDPIAWHPAFIEAMQMELEAYAEALEFHPEFQLTSEPLRIDCVVIKKARGISIKKNIAAIFRDVNILEYKSPDDYVAIEDFYKAYAYACLYASFERVPITSITITVIESRYPRDLLAHFKKERNYQVEETSPGIYTIRGDILPMQIINCRRLPQDENLWLKDLDNRLAIMELRRVFAAANNPGRRAQLHAYLDAIIRANRTSLQELMKMSKTELTLDQIFEEAGLTAKWEARGEAKGEARAGKRKAIAIAQNMVNQGYPIEAIVAATELDSDTVAQLFTK